MTDILDLEFDRYGDINFLGNDISALQSRLDHVYQGVIDRLITNHGDYDLYPTFGANLSSLVGQRNDSELEEEVSRLIHNALTADRFLTRSDIEVVALRSYHNIMVKITIGQSYNSLHERIVVNSIFNTSSGLFYVTN